jgi:hypothetical protein
MRVIRSIRIIDLLAESKYPQSYPKATTGGTFRDFVYINQDV